MNSMNSIPIILSIEDASEYFNMPKLFIRERVWNKEIPYMKSGNKYFISVSGFIDFIEDACRNHMEFEYRRNVKGEE